MNMDSDSKRLGICATLCDCYQMRIKIFQMGVQKGVVDALSCYILYKPLFSRTVIFAFLDFCGNSRDVVITINRHELKWKFSRGSGSRNSRK